ncbi:hypothetical protein BDQ17DRAFT_1409876, partial [Cyathus striatus]
MSMRSSSLWECTLRIVGEEGRGECVVESVDVQDIKLVLWCWQCKVDIGEKRLGAGKPAVHVREGKKLSVSALLKLLTWLHIATIHSNFPSQVDVYPKREKCVEDVVIISAIDASLVLGQRIDDTDECGLGMHPPTTLPLPQQHYAVNIPLRAANTMPVSTYTVLNTPTWTLSQLVL